jgi:molybdopterin molybdotransferase
LFAVLAAKLAVQTRRQGDTMQSAATVLDFDQALAVVLQHATDLPLPPSKSLLLLQCGSRILAEPILADRDQPPFHRSTRDGFALRASDTPGHLTVVGQVRAGEQWQGSPLEPNATIEIMTGAPIPEGADAVVMIEHIERTADSIHLLTGRTIRSGENIVPQGSEARAGQTVLPPGTPIEGAEIALAASCGYSKLKIFRRPKVAIVATGDELVDLAVTPAPSQIRNSNSYCLAELIHRAGGEPIQLPIAPDRRPELEQTIRAARRCDLMLLSGGVSMGKYDLVEEVLQTLGAEFFFTGVKMQPGKPLVFGRLPAESNLPSQFFFGLPGNPISTQVTFHCFVEPMLRAMAGAGIQGPRFVQTTLAEDVAGKTGLMRILPARWTSDRIRPEVRLVAWQGSGDLAANARANCYAVLPPDKEHFAAGDVITILLR